MTIKKKNIKKGNIMPTLRGQKWTHFSIVSDKISDAGF